MSNENTPARGLDTGGKPLIAITATGKACAVRELPAAEYIGGAAERLYRLEERRNEAIADAAREHGRILKHTEDQFYSHSLPAQLYATLSGFERAASIAAALAYLRNECGFAIDIKAEAPPANQAPDPAEV